MTDNADYLQLVERMPAFPQSVSRVLDLTARADCAPRELVRVIEHDPVMTMKILKLVNSAFYGLAKPINSINHAVVYVGINTVKNLAITIAAIGVLPRQSSVQMKMDEFLMHSLGVAAISKKLSLSLGIPDQESTDFFVAGLLHDFGKVVLAQYKSESYRSVLDEAAAGEVTLADAEQCRLGIDHAEIGGRLADCWKLPPKLGECIRYHHSSDIELLDGRMRDAVDVANRIAHATGFGQSGNCLQEPLSERLCDRFGGDLAGIIQSLGDLDEEKQKARAFIQQ